jgi:ATP-grasp domain
MLQRTILFVALRYTEFYSADLLERYKKDHDVRIVACVDRESLGKISAPVKQAVDAVHVLPSVNRLDFWPVFAQDDVEAVLRAERAAFPEREVSIICCDELNLTMIGSIRRKHGMRGPNDEELSKFRDKLLMKQLLREDGIRVPQFSPFDAQGFLAGKASWADMVDKVGSRFVVKPVDAAASAGIEVIDSEQRLIAYCKRSDPTCQLEIEEFVDGKLYHVDSFTQEGKHIFHVVSEYTCPNADFAKGNVLGSINLPPEDPLRNRLVDFAARVLDTLKPTNLCSHMELFVTRSEIIFLEVAGRPPGAAVCRSHLLGCGINFMDMDFKIQTGQPIDVLTDAGGHAFWAYVPKLPGKVSRLDGPALKSKFDLQWRVRENEEVLPASTVLDVAAVIVASNASYDQLRRDFEYVRDSWAPFGKNPVLA